MHLDSQNSFQDESSTIHQKESVDDFTNLYKTILQFESKDAFIHYLLGVLCIKIGLLKQAINHLCISVSEYPYNWSAWLDLSRIINSVAALQDILSRVPSTFMSICFQIQALNELNESPDLSLSLVNLIAHLAPKFSNMQRALIYHHKRGISL